MERPPSAQPVTAMEAADRRLQLLEERLLYQERTIDQLSEVLLDHQAQLDRLAEEVLRLKAMLTILADRPADNSDEPPPPHY